jgi:hypothetical protein
MRGPGRGRTILRTTAEGDAQRAAHGGDRMHGLVGSYEFERRDGVVLVS